MNLYSRSDVVAAIAVDAAFLSVAILVALSVWAAIHLAGRIRRHARGLRAQRQAAIAYYLAARTATPASDIQPDPTATAHHHTHTEADHDLDTCRAIWATRTSGLEWAADLHKAIRALPETQPSREEDPR